MGVSSEKKLQQNSILPIVRPNQVSETIQIEYSYHFGVP